MPSPRPKPTALKIASGNPGKRALNKREPKTAGVPVMPPHMTEKAQAGWVYVLPILQSRGLAGDLDTWALEQMCECYAEVIQLRQEIAGLGERTYETMSENGTMHRAYPQVAMLADADRRLKGWLIEFGLTPAARSKVEMSGDGDKEKPEDPEAKYFGSRAAV